MPGGLDGSDGVSDEVSDEVDEVVSIPLEEGGASAWDSEDLAGSTPDFVSSCGDGVDAESSVGRESVLRSSSGSAVTAMRVPTLTLLEPSGCYMVDQL